MLYIVITMLVIVAVAGLVVAFVAFPHRGEDLPGAPWLGDTMGRAAGSLRTIADGELDTTPGSHRATGPYGDTEPDRDPESDARL